MTIAFDAATNGTSGGFTHTPVGTPRGILVTIRMLNASDVVTGVTYGGTAMSEVALSPLIASGAEGGTCYGYFLGSSVPTGAQSCVVSVSAGTPRATCYSLTASADTEVVDTTTINETGVSGDRTGTLSLGGRTCFVAEAIWSAQGAVTGVNPLTGWTARQETDEGSETNYGYSYDTVGSSDVTFGATMVGTDDIAILGIAVSEVAGGSAVTGTAAQTLPSLTQSASGSEKFLGTVAQTLPKLAQAASASTSSALTATVAQTLPKLTQAAVAVEKFLGTAAQVLPKLTQAASGDVVASGVSGTVAQTLPSLTQAAAGTALVNATGTVAQILPFPQQAALGVVDNPGDDVVAPPPGGGKGRKHRRRILLADGRILIPANDQEYRRAVEQIIADFEKPEPAKPPKRRAEAKKVAQPKKPAPVKRLPKEFHKAVDNHTTGVLNYLAIQSAWEAYEAQQDEEAVEMLLMVS